MGKKKKKNTKKKTSPKAESNGTGNGNGNGNGNGTGQKSDGQGGKVKKTAAEKRAGSFHEPKIKEALTKPKDPPTVFNRIPYMLRHEKGLSDIVAGSLVLLAGGLLIVVVSYILILVWPAR